MSISTVGRRGRLALACAALAAALALPAAALADTTPGGGGDATMTVDSVTVVGKAVAVVHLSIVCLPFDSYDWTTGQTTTTTEGSIEFSSLQVLQAQGRTLASGTADFYGPVTCDGTSLNHVDASVPASTSPWKNGTAVVSGRASISDAATFSDQDVANLGPTAVRLSTH